ncbi:unnamed protein product [Acanthoscelides obtectus]|uniref:Uncharacterized protein n=2 Tax=Acanthoscelides obtectus TaxID=200917 RepID=A0A9P0L8V7_ACAOB|nr:unnamed protein product [Acanthoscelides obtectus]CAK1666273.1 Cysteine-rich protein 1 [Acanthoscelides obtectus]
MWKCHKCQKPVYFAERKQSLGYNWHPECLRCEECGKRLNPGQHAEHKGVPYCHVPCYGALFGPQLFGHGTRVESHKSFGAQKESPKLGKSPALPRSHLESKIKVYNQYYEGRSGEIRCREVNGRYVLEGPLRVRWGVRGVIHLKEDDDQRTVVTALRKRNSYRHSSAATTPQPCDTDDDVADIPRDASCEDVSVSTTSEGEWATANEEHSDNVQCKSGIDSANNTSPTDSTDSPTLSPQYNIPKSVTLPTKLDLKNDWDELDELLRVERKIDVADNPYQTMPATLLSQSMSDNSGAMVKEMDTGGKDESVTEGLDDTVTTTEDSKTLIAPIVNGTNEEDKIPLLISSMESSFTSQDDTWSTCSNHLNRSMSGPDCLCRVRDPHSPEFDSVSVTSTDISTYSEQNEEVVLRRPHRGSTAIKRRPGKRLSRTKVKRRCSINGHFYDRETSFFTPPYGSQMSVWVTSLVSTGEVINLILEKYKVESDQQNFALFVIRDNGGEFSMNLVSIRFFRQLETHLARYLLRNMF